MPLLFLSTAVVAVGLFMYGWSAEARTFWLSAVIGAAIFSIGAAMTFTSIQTYVIDSYPLFAAICDRCNSGAEKFDWGWVPALRPYFV